MDGALIGKLEHEIAGLEALLAQKKAELDRLKNETLQYENVFQPEAIGNVPHSGINKLSTPEEKIALFRSLFRGRDFQVLEQGAVPAAGAHDDRLPASEPAITGTPLTIQELFKRLWAGKDRNRLIIQDIAAAHAEGREILVLSERLDHLALLAEALAPYTDYLFVLKGGMGKKQVKTIMEHTQQMSVLLMKKTVFFFIVYFADLSAFKTVAMLISSAIPMSRMQLL